MVRQECYQHFLINFPSTPLLSFWSKEDIDAIEERSPIRASHLVHLDTNQGGVGVLEVTYRLTDHSLPSKKYRGMDNLGSSSFLKVGDQRLMPRRGALDNLHKLFDTMVATPKHIDSLHVQLRILRVPGQVSHDSIKMQEAAIHEVTVMMHI